MKIKIIALVIFTFSIILTPTNNNKIAIKEDLVIGGRQSKSIFYLSTMDVDEKDFIYIGDKKGFKIIKFSKKGKFIKKFGQKGLGPGDFPAPVFSVNYSSDKLYVCFENHPNIYVYDAQLNFLYFSGIDSGAASSI